jgi:5-methylcytosine-specific restriction endonuclease McrA
MSFLPTVRNGAIVYRPKKLKNIKGAKRLIRIKREKRRARKLSKRKRLPTRYHAYIASEHWVRRRNRYWREHPRLCAACFGTAYLQLHHMVYRKEEYGFERDSDLMPLCQQDHQEYHNRYGTQGNMLKTTHAFIDERRQELEMAALLERI